MFNRVREPELRRDFGRAGGAGLEQKLECAPSQGRHRVEPGLDEDAPGVVVADADQTEAAEQTAERADKPAGRFAVGDELEFAPVAVADDGASSTGDEDGERDQPITSVTGRRERRT